MSITAQDFRPMHQYDTEAPEPDPRRTRFGKLKNLWVIKGLDLVEGRFEQIVKNDGSSTVVRITKIRSRSKLLMSANFDRRQPGSGDTIRYANGRIVTL